MPNPPKISVLFPVFNSVKFLQGSLDSILRQSYADFEIIAIDDASTDGSLEMLRKVKDSRLKVYAHSNNLGITRTLNEAIAHAGGKYVARMDADDISHPDRFARQSAILDANPDIGVCGTWCRLMGPAGDSGGLLKTPIGNRPDFLYWRPPVVAHPTVMARRSLMQDNPYNASMPVAQDYELWLRLSSITRIRNIPDPLLFYRFSTSGTTSIRRDLQREMTYGAFAAKFVKAAINPKEFGALCYWNEDVSPLQRMNCLGRLRTEVPIPYPFFLLDSCRYLLFWIKRRIRNDR